ncbi:hypothetical protein BCV72DRAFT_231440 [Rhizopus microsporus var. microsporus]|uniref:Uncharacterized protein n=1 Tax=Rhizopus microsporus var. microsporus TaxID=86635 RepID=A0A1X0QXQ1_RHIZD|nr:hypothetical protein BCV72DRAFT_231440 [Rhizopus microsporus var. microsporus]
MLKDTNGDEYALVGSKDVAESGRRIELIVNCSRLGVNAELCSIEFKRQDASKLVVSQQ